MAGEAPHQPSDDRPSLIVHGPGRLDAIAPLTWISGRSDGWCREEFLGSFSGCSFGFLSSGQSQ